MREGFLEKKKSVESTSQSKEKLLLSKMSSLTLIDHLNLEMEKNIETRRKEIASLGIKIAKGKKKSSLLYLKMSLTKKRRRQLRSNI